MPPPPVHPGSRDPATGSVRRPRRDRGDRHRPRRPDELAEHIFTDGFTTKDRNGRRHHGIGLALVHRLIHKAGGTITVDCTGPTTFTVILPLAGAVEVDA